MTRVVSNATPLIYLAKIGRIDLLVKVFSEVYVPEEVKLEVVDEGKRLGKVDAYVVEDAIANGWIEVSSAEMVEIPIPLEAGEAAVISLAKNMRIGEVLMDEVSARTAARLMDLTPRGTILVLLKALELKEISLNEFMAALGDLVKQGFRLKEEVYLEAITRAREIDGKKGNND